MLFFELHKKYNNYIEICAQKNEEKLRARLHMSFFFRNFAAAKYAFQKMNHMKDEVIEAEIVIDESRREVIGELMRNVYLWMAGGLGLTGVFAWIVANSEQLLSIIFGSQVVFWGLFIGELALVVILSGIIQKLRFGTAAILFMLYCILNGMTMSTIFLLYELSSVCEIFFVTAGAFAGLAFVGTVIKKDLSGFGTFLLIALIGLIIASVVGSLMGHPDSIWISALGVLIFAGLTVYDAQKIRMLMMNQETVNEGAMKIALLGALSLYLDFINLFLRLLSIFGKRR